MSRMRPNIVEHSTIPLLITPQAPSRSSWHPGVRLLIDQHYRSLRAFTIVDRRAVGEVQQADPGGAPHAY